jgi:hypothetical protein
VCMFYDCFIHLFLCTRSPPKVRGGGECGRVRLQRHTGRRINKARALSSVRFAVDFVRVTLLIIVLQQLSTWPMARDHIGIGPRRPKDSTATEDQKKH